MIGYIKYCNHDNIHLVVVSIEPFFLVQK